MYMNIYYNIDEYICIYHRPSFISDNFIACFTILGAKMVHEDTCITFESDVSVDWFLVS